MSMFNEECICMKCKSEEMLRPNYAEAVKKDIEEHKKKNSFKCCICGKEFSDYVNNPVPVIALGKCCDECNQKVVIPARYKAVKILEDFCNELD